MPARQGWPGSPVPVSSGRDGGLRGHSYSIFKKGNILFLYIFISLSACAPWRFYALPMISLWACAPLPVSCFIPFSSSHPHFMQHVPLTPCALPCLLPAGAVPVKPCRQHGSLGDRSCGSSWLGQAMGQDTGLAFCLKHRRQRGPGGTAAGKCWCSQGPVLHSILHRAASCGAGQLRNVCAEGRGCPSCRLRPTPHSAGCSWSKAHALLLWPLGQDPLCGAGPWSHCGWVLCPEPGSAGSQWSISHHLSLGHTRIFVALFYTEQ